MNESHTIIERALMVSIVVLRPKKHSIMDIAISMTKQRLSNMGSSRSIIGHFLRKINTMIQCGLKRFRNRPRIFLSNAACTDISDGSKHETLETHRWLLRLSLLVLWRRAVEAGLSVRGRRTDHRRQIRRLRLPLPLPLPLPLRRQHRPRRQRPVRATLWSHR